VTQAAQRIAGAVWALDPALAHQRHFPAVDWSQSYSLYGTACGRWFADQVGADWLEIRRELMELLQRERELRDIAGLIGTDALEARDRLVMEVARAVRELLLRQSAFHAHDAASSVRKTYELAAVLRKLHQTASAAVGSGAAVERLDLDAVRRTLVRLRDASDEEVDARAREARESVEQLAAAAARRG
jgi:V/A-type H+-transporting ATPase subunit A